MSKEASINTVVAFALFASAPIRSRVLAFLQLRYFVRVQGMLARGIARSDVTAPLARRPAMKQGHHKWLRHGCAPRDQTSGWAPPSPCSRFSLSYGSSRTPEKGGRTQAYLLVVVKQHIKLIRARWCSGSCDTPPTPRSVVLKDAVLFILGLRCSKLRFVCRLGSRETRQHFKRATCVRFKGS